MPVPAPTNGQGEPPPVGGSAGSAAAAESPDVLVAVGEEAGSLGLVVGLPCVAVGFAVEERDVLELDEECLLELVVVVEAAGPSLTVGTSDGGRDGLLLVGGVPPLPNVHPSNPPTTTLWLIAPRLLYVQEPPFDAYQYDQ